MQAQRCRWTGKFNRRSWPGLLFHQGKCRKLKPCSHGLSAGEALGTRLMYMTSQAYSFLIIETQRPWEGTFDRGLLLEKIGDRKLRDRKTTFRASTPRQMAWQVLQLLFIIIVLSITESVQLISVYKKRNL